MEGIRRKPFQGVQNIIRFNWHFYAIALVLVAVSFITIWSTSDSTTVFFTYILLMTAFGTFMSLGVSFYVYDCSDLYVLNWLNFLDIKTDSRLVNINAGFDETSFLLSKKYSASNLLVFDFYDPGKHTEISIERARKSHSVHPDTKTIETTDIPLASDSVDYIFSILSAHEIRNIRERIIFFQGLRESLKKDGRIIVVEHLRDTPNFLAYNFGFFHFFSKKEWVYTFNLSGLRIDKEIKITPFLSAFILQKNGISS